MLEAGEMGGIHNALRKCNILTVDVYVVSVAHLVDFMENTARQAHIKRGTK